ncbi:MAG: RluA family pseudouridine synthase [Bacteroidales bacterium]|nr:RluA family pseudouridine synthase [Bacteroidales bacterium]
MATNSEQNEEQNELFEHYRFVCDKGQGILRIDKYLMDKIENASRTKIQSAAKAGNILVNNISVKPSYKIKPLDVISIVLSFPPREIEIIPEDIPIDIIYEDNDILLVNKKPGMVVHPAYANYSGTLVNALHYHFLHKSKFKNEDGQVYLAHRIDKGTSGVLLVAKNEFSQSKLAKQFFNHTIERKYIALVWGDLNEDTGTIEGHIGRSLKNRKVMTVFPNGEYGKEAITHYKVIRRSGYVTLVECQLETGRTHQIRAHFKYINHPLFNDATYGGDLILKGTTFTKYKQFVNNCFKLLPRQALHAKSLGFIHPITKKKLFFDSELPEDMKSAIDKWEHYSNFFQTNEED